MSKPSRTRAIAAARIAATTYVRLHVDDIHGDMTDRGWDGDE
jgi:hypothetical protein